MAALTWDASGTHFYETGVSNGVLYVMGENGYENGVAWNGLTAVTESPEGAEATALYADNIKYLNLISEEDFKATIEAYTYPDEFEPCIGYSSIVTGAVAGQQARKTFAFCYQTKIGNDVDGNSKGYKIHIIYGCSAAPAEKAYATINDSPEAITFSWEISTTPVEINASLKPTAHIEIDSTKTDSTKLDTLKEFLYGSATAEPTLALPADVIRMLT